MGFNSKACLWLTRPADGLAIVEQLLGVFEQENVLLNDEDIYFNDLSSGEERSPEPIDGRTIDQCFEVLLQWPAFGGIEIFHPAISPGTGISVYLHSLNPSHLEYVTVSMQYFTKSGEYDEQQLFLFSRRLFTKIEEFGLLFGESPEEDTFRMGEYSCFIEALSKVHHLQLKKEQGERGFFEKMMLTRSLNTTFKG